MADSGRMKSIELALTNETRERAFYLKHAERTRNEVGKAMFLQIADEELEHYRRLEELHARWKKEEKWPETVPLQVQDTRVKDVLVKVLKQVEGKPESDADDLEAIRTALDFEFKGEAFYRKLADQVSEPKEKALFTLLSRIEREHALSLQEAEEFLTDPEGYYRTKEHHGLDGV